MNNENIHPILMEPPLAHALHRFDASTNALSYEYNGIDIMTFYFNEGDEVGFRHGSDGTLQSKPYIQQIYIMVNQPTKVVCEFQLSHDAICMRPHRAKPEQGILGQIGRPLIYNVNGLYDVYQDLLIEWLGQPFEWNEERIYEDEMGRLKCSMTIELGSKPFFVNLYMSYYRHHLGYEYHKPWVFRPNQKAVSGWCSWEAMRRDVSIKDIQKASDFFGEHLGAYGFEYIQLDDGYEEMPLPKDETLPLPHGWLTTNSQFPQGHWEIVRSIQEKGLVPGIWTNANVTNELFAENFYDHFLTRENGELLKGEWIDYLLNCSKESLDIQVAPYYKGLKDFGYLYFKTDAIRHLQLDGLHEAVRLGILSNEEAQSKFRAFMETARENIGDDAYFLASWGVLSEAVGLVDSCRIAMDANPTWAGIRMQLFESARWFHTQRILFLNDPDHICARAKIDWTRTVTSLVSLTGSLFMLSDPIDVYEGERLEIIKRNLPPLETIAAETGPLKLDYAAYTWTKLHGFAVPRENPVEAEDVTIEDAINMAGDSPTSMDIHPFSSLWAFHLDKNNRQWCVMARMATVPLQETIISIQQLQLKPNIKYHQVDYWKRKYMGITQEFIPCEKLDVGECQVIGITKVKEIPHIICCFRHVSMGAVLIQKECFEKNTLTLELSGIEGEEEMIWVHSPSTYRIEYTKSEGCQVQREDMNSYIEISVRFFEKDAIIELHYN